MFNYFLIYFFFFMLIFMFIGVVVSSKLMFWSFEQIFVERFDNLKVFEWVIKHMLCSTYVYLQKGHSNIDIEFFPFERKKKKANLHLLQHIHQKYSSSFFSVFIFHLIYLFFTHTHTHSHNKFYTLRTNYLSHTPTPPLLLCSSFHLITSTTKTKPNRPPPLPFHCQFILIKLQSDCTYII